jgi:hypothetical protein
MKIGMKLRPRVSARLRVQSESQWVVSKPELARLKRLWGAICQTTATATRLLLSAPAARDELLLHMQQRFAQGYSGLNVRSCRLASRSTSTRRRPLQAATVPVAPGNRTAESGPAAADRSSPPPATPSPPRRSAAATTGFARGGSGEPRAKAGRGPRCAPIRPDRRASGSRAGRGRRVRRSGWR